MIYSTQENFIHAITQYDQKRKLYRLFEDYTLEWGDSHLRKRLFIAAGYEYDKASVPKILWGLARPDGPWDTASLFHDRLYQDQGWFPHPDSFRFETLTNRSWRLDPSRWRRPQMDELLRFVGVLGGANPAMAKVYKLAVAYYPPNLLKPF